MKDGQVNLLMMKNWNTMYSLEVNILIEEVIKKENEFKKKSELDTLIFDSMD